MFMYGNLFAYCTPEHFKALQLQHQILPDDGMCGVPKHVAGLTACVEHIRQT